MVKSKSLGTLTTKLGYKAMVEVMLEEEMRNYRV